MLFYRAFKADQTPLNTVAFWLHFIKCFELIKTKYVGKIICSLFQPHNLLLNGVFSNGLQFESQNKVKLLFKILCIFFRSFMWTELSFFYLTAVMDELYKTYMRSDPHERVIGIYTHTYTFRYINTLVTLRTLLTKKLLENASILYLLHGNFEDPHEVSNIKLSSCFKYRTQKIWWSW